MADESLEQRMADTEVRIQQLQARKQALAQAVRQQDRKERTRRLIQIGGVMARLGVDTLEKAQAFHGRWRGVPRSRPGSDGLLLRRIHRGWR